VELKARFDERANIAWARKLEEAGCHVVYGFVGMKTHAKAALVVREEPDGGLRRYCHIGTGNYHPTTARLYEDFGLLTADPTVGEDITDLFNNLTGYSRKRSYRRLLVAPQGLRAGLVDRINRQAQNALAGLPSQIQFKCNSLTDEAIMDALYRASIAGVPIDLWIRGICSLRPGVPGLSETIRVRSVLGRFLEHARVYGFGPAELAGRARSAGQAKAAGQVSATGEAQEVWLGSSDLMHRNLDRRVELLVRVSDRGQQKKLRDLLTMGMADTTASWWLGPDGTWTRHHLDASGAPLRDLQAHLVQTRRTGGRSASEADRRQAKQRHFAERDRVAGRRVSPGRTGTR